MSKKIKYLFVISILVLSLLVLPFSVSANTGDVYTMPIAQPTIDSRTGFVEVLATSSAGVVRPYVFIYTIVNMNTDDVPADPIVNFSATLNSVSFRSPEDCYLYLTEIHDDGNLLFFNPASDGSSLTSNFPGGILGIHYYGNIRYSSAPSFTSQPAFTVAYSSDAASYDLLRSIYSTLNLLSNNVSSFLPGISQNTSYLPGMAQDTSEILDYLASIFESNQQFIEDLDNYFQDNNWSLLSNIDTQLITLVSYLDPSGQNNLYDYLLSMSQDSQEILEYLDLFNQYFTHQVFSVFSDIDSSLIEIEGHTFNSSRSLSDFYDSFIIFEGELYSYLDMFLEEGLGNPEYDSPSDVSPPRDDSTIQDIEDAEQEALGGMTQEEVKEQVDEVLDSSSEAEEIGATEINVNNIAVVNNLFTDMFGVFGGAWSTFFLLNLTIAFAAFLIGRRY